MGITFLLFPIVLGIVVVMFALVSFTLWRVVKKTSKVNPAVPKMLQFHEDGSVDNANENTRGPRITRFQSVKSLF